MIYQEQADELVSYFMPIVRANAGESYTVVYDRARDTAFEHVVLLQRELKKLNISTPYWSKVLIELK